MQNDKDNNLTDFGFQRVDPATKTAKVADVFHSVAKNYDLMNDLMSLGLHRLWKKIAIEYCQVRQGHTVLDLAGGTGDLAIRLSPLVGEKGKIFLADINASMLKEARARIIDLGLIHNVDLIQADAQKLPFPSNYFDRIIIGFGLRNVTKKDEALKSMYRVLKPGGHLIILEFSEPVIPGLKQGYDIYSFNILPVLGEWVAKDKESYQYLAESIRMHPNQNTLIGMLKEAGFEEAKYFNLLGGIVAIHKALKY